MGSKVRQAGVVAVLLASTLALVSGCGGSKSTAEATSQSTSQAATSSPASPAPPCGIIRKPRAVWQHVIWIVMENKSYDEIVDSDAAPYLNGLARTCGLATNVHSESGPSLPNYIAMTSGSTQGIEDDNDPAFHPLAVPSIFSQLEGDWRTLAESMPFNCALENKGDYAVRHNPAAHYTDIRSECSEKDVPLASRPDLSARFTFIAPNACHDMHPCEATGDDVAAQIRLGDTWLSHFLPTILNSSEYRSGSTAVFITWDENDLEGYHVTTLVISPSTPAGTRSATLFSHYSLLRTTEEMLGITTYLGQADSANSMRSGFNL